MSSLASTTTVRRDGLVIREHRFDLPLCYRAVSGGSESPEPSGSLDCGCSAGDNHTISVFARELVRAGDDTDSQRPYLVWFQGGPGNPADRPGQPGGWLAKALEEFRVVLLDQRGTGLSTPATASTVPGETPREQANYLTHFRADSIVRDAEQIRVALAGDRPWTALGQSFGGFTTVSYLSLAPEGLAAALITAGLPSLDGSADDVYRLTFAQTKARNEEFFATYPDDSERLQIVCEHLGRIDERLPSGEVLTRERFLSLGILLGTQAGFDRLHYLLEFAVPDPKVAGSAENFRLSDAFLVEAFGVLSFQRNPLYAVLHEPIYARGEGTNWAAQRIRDSLPEFSAGESTPDGGYLFTGEMIFPGHFASDPVLEPLADAARELASRNDWPALYRPDVLGHNEVPVAAAVYTEDMFVPASISLKTAEAIHGIKLLITNDYQHDGIRQDGASLFGRLLAKTKEN